MVIAIDAVGAKHSGAATVLRAVVGAALERPEIGRVVAYCSPASMREFSLTPTSHFEVVDEPSAESGAIGRMAWVLHGLSKRLRKLRPDAVLLLAGAGLVPRGIRSVLVIQQSLPFSPEALSTLTFRDRVKMCVLARLMKVSSSRADAVIVQTLTMKDAVVTSLGIEERRVHVRRPCATIPVETGRDHTALARMQDAEEGKRVLYVGNSMPYKNLAALSAAIPVVRRVSPGVTLFATLPSTDALGTVEGTVMLGNLEPSVLFAAYRLATVVVMPSLVETVGLPLIEAMSCGTPVVAADRPYAREVCCDAALFFDPSDPVDLAEKVVALISKEGLRLEMIERGRARSAAWQALDGYRTMIEVALGIGPEGKRAS